MSRSIVLLLAFLSFAAPETEVRSCPKEHPAEPLIPPNISYFPRARTNYYHMPACFNLQFAKDGKSFVGTAYGLGIVRGTGPAGPRDVNVYFEKDWMLIYGCHGPFWGGSYEIYLVVASKNTRDSYEKILEMVHYSMDYFGLRDVLEIQDFTIYDETCVKSAAKGRNPINVCLWVVHLVVSVMIDI